jgi:hypothetical protein
MEVYCQHCVGLLAEQGDWGLNRLAFDLTAEILLSNKENRI